MASWRNAASLLLLALPWQATAGPTCKDMMINVHAETQGSKIEISPLPGPDAVGGALLSLLTSALGGVGKVYPVIPISGTFDISSRYCAPEVDNENGNTIEILAHGATYAKSYWNGLDLPADEAQKYSWVDYASKRGYHTVAIDRIGTGKSTQGDPLLQVQVNLDAESVSVLAQKLRDGVIDGKKFKNVVYVGHSMGSIIGDVAAHNHDSVFDALILTGWSGNVLENFVKILPALFLPAPVAALLSIPPKLKWLTRNPLYLVFTIKENVRSIFYAGKDTYDTKIFDRDYDTRDVVSLGEMLTLFNGETAARTFKNPVHVAIGDVDTIFCDSTKGGKCGNGPDDIPQNAKVLFPAASNFSTHITPQAGHCINLHYNAEDQFKAAHDFLHFNLIN